MRSVRLSDEMEKRLLEAAKACGEPISDFIRVALHKRCKEVLGDRLDVALADVIGIVKSGKKSRRSLHTGREFTKILLEKKRKKRL